jgi:hypothetical protein
VPPFPVGPETLFIAYYASAELGCFRALNWPMPTNVLDLFIEFRNRTNGLTTPAGSGLVGALTYFGIDHAGPHRSATRVTARSVHEGGGGDGMERHADRHGDVCALLREYWTDIQDELIRKIDVDYGVFDGRSFRADRWAEYLNRNGIPWPRLESGRLDLSDDAFRQMAKASPAVSPMRELRSSLSDLRLNDLAVGKDGRNRTILSAFRARSGRNAPSNTRFIFGPSVRLRSLIQPPPGYGLCYCDWSQQEFGIGGALSGDQAMQEAYLSGDPYLAFAKQAGAVPTDATKESHAATRELFKTCALGVQYGMEWNGRAWQRALASRRSSRAT